MITKKVLLITALCSAVLLSACDKNQSNAENIISETMLATLENTAVNESVGENTVIDVFSDLSVTFDGINDKGKIIFQYTGDSDFVNEYVEFKSDKSYEGLRNGEIITVTLDYNDFKAEQLGITFKELEREYTVEGLWGSIVSHDGYDFSELDKQINTYFLENERSAYLIEYINKYMDSQNSQKDATENTLFISSPDGDKEVGTRDAAYWKIRSVSCEPYAKILGVFSDKSFGQENYYDIYYKVSLEVEKSPLEIRSPSKDTIYNVGDIKQWDFLGIAKAYNVSVDKSSIVVQNQLNLSVVILETNSEYYNSDFDVFLNNYIDDKTNYGFIYYSDISDDNQQWEEK